MFHSTTGVGKPTTSHRSFVVLPRKPVTFPGSVSENLGGPKSRTRDRVFLWVVIRIENVLTGRQTVRLGLTVRQTNWETGRHTDLEKGRQKDRQTHRQKDIDRQTERRVERLWIIDLEARYRQKRLLSCEKADQNTQLIKGKTNKTKDIKKKTCSPKTISFTRAT